MFFLSVIEHTLRLPPHLLGLAKEKALRQELENLFLDKAIANLGLCVSVYDVHSISGGFIFPGDGAPTYTCQWDSLMTSTYLFISFHIHHGLHLIQKMEITSGGYGSTVQQMTSKKMPRHQGQHIRSMRLTIRLRVHNINYPPIPLDQPKDAKPFAPMVITGSLDNDGLGPLSWWE